MIAVGVGRDVIVLTRIVGVRAIIIVLVPLILRRVHVLLLVLLRVSVFSVSWHLDY